MGGLTWIMHPGINRLPALLPSLIFVPAVGTVAFLLLSLFYKVSIRISRKLMASSAEKNIIIYIFEVGGIYFALVFLENCFNIIFFEGA